MLRSLVRVTVAAAEWSRARQFVETALMGRLLDSASPGTWAAAMRAAAAQPDWHLGYALAVQSLQSESARLGQAEHEYSMRACAAMGDWAAGDKHLRASLPLREPTNSLLAALQILRATEDWAMAWGVYMVESYMAELLSRPVANLSAEEAAHALTMALEAANGAGEHPEL